VIKKNCGEYQINTYAIFFKKIKIADFFTDFQLLAK